MTVSISQPEQENSPETQRINTLVPRYYRNKVTKGEYEILFNDVINPWERERKYMVLKNVGTSEIFVLDKQDFLRAAYEPVV